MTTSRAWHLVRRPVGEPVADDFSLVETPVPTLGAGALLVRNTFLSVDPYMRGRMNEARSYVPSFRLDQPMEGGAVGVVEEAEGACVDGTGAPVTEGDTVVHDFGWRTHAVLPSTRARVVDAARAPAQAYLGILGMPGLTAYAGLLRVADFREGDRVFVSGAAGAVGSIVGQIARLRGASLVVGSAGGPEKVRWLRDELGFDRAVDYQAAPIAAGLREATPEGIDVYFDNVGGDHLEAAISSLRVGGRVAICGMISAYNAAVPPPGPRNLPLVIGKRLTLKGFLVIDHGDLRADFEREVGSWLAEGRLVWRETVVDGIEHTVGGFLSLFSGANTGKMLIRLAND